MRKYQQLVLLLISCLSVGILLMYKSENNRLKYVLKYVNFFGRSDVAVLRRLDNGTKEYQHVPQLARPLPVWQLIGDSFHAYSAYWKRNELVAGGEAHALIVGRRGAVVDFRCSLIYDDALARSVQGKFRFQRAANESLLDEPSSSFTSYNFFCQVSRDFGQPAFVTFSDTTASVKSQVKLRLRHLKTTKLADSDKSPAGRLPATLCVDLVSFNMSSRFAHKADNLLQFFLFHQALGIEHFLLYNSDALPERVVHLLGRTKMQLYALPFNFPFKQSNLTASRVRQLIETDCLLRNVNAAGFTMLLAPNELLYPSARLASNPAQPSLQQQLRHYSSETSRFELACFAVCFDDDKKLLVDNTHYDPELKPPHKMLLHRLELSPTQLLAQQQSVELPLSTGFVHRYVDCPQLAADGLHDWRNGVREDFMEHINALRNELDLLI